MRDPFGLMQFAECEHKQLKCEKCGARSDIRGWQTFTGQDKELLQLREENESITARLAAAQTRNECPICGLTPGAISTCFCEECVGELRQRLAAAEAVIVNAREAARLVFHKATFIGTAKEYNCFPGWQKIAEMYTWLAQQEDEAANGGHDEI